MNFISAAIVGLLIVVGLVVIGVYLGYKFGYSKGYDDGAFSGTLQRCTHHKEIDRKYSKM